MDERKIEGLRIEGLVADEMKRRGFTILARNFSRPFGEIDIVAGKDRQIVVCEVRSRQSGEIDDATDTVGPGKRRKIRMTTQAYLLDCPYEYDEVRFFVAAVIYGTEPVIMQIFEDAF